MSGEDEGEVSAEAFYAHVIPAMWIGLLDLCHDIMMRLGDFLEVQGKMVEEAKLYLRPDGAEIIDLFPTDNDEGA